VDYAPQFHIFTAGETGGSLDIAERLRERPDVLSADPMLSRRYKKHWVPDDTFFGEQWHLLNTGQGGGTAGIDVHVTNVWETYRGAGIVVGIVDDGLETDHPDLVTNVNTAIDHNWNGGDPQNPYPDLLFDYHGTPCAGIVAACGNNATGVCGVAPGATLVGLRALAGPMSDADDAEVVLHSNALIHVKSNSWGPYGSMQGPGPLGAAALALGAETGREGKGTVFVFSAGNQATEGEDANYNGFANSRFTIAVGSFDDRGEHSNYSEPGACILVTAPSSGSPGITTTDLTTTNGYNQTGSGDLADTSYTKLFGGTSASCPSVAGVVALMLEANPSLTYRDVHHILVRSAEKVDSGDSDWQTNSAGHSFNHKYGAGAVHADAAVTLAETWTSVAQQVSAATRVETNLLIPDNLPSGVTIPLHLTNSDLIVEHVEVTPEIEHRRRGDLAITLTSPGGMESRLAEQRSDQYAYGTWTFTSVRHWEENSEGTWSLKVADNSSGYTGVLQQVKIDVYGIAADTKSNAPPVFFPIGERSLDVGQFSEFEVSAGDIVDFDLVTLTASNVPVWGQFGTVSNAGVVTNSFTGTPTDTGVYAMVFHATDKDGIDSEACSVRVVVPPMFPLSEDFKYGLPAGWTVVTNGDLSAYWRSDNPGGRRNYTGGEWPYAIADSGHAGNVDMDTELLSPVLDMDNLVSARLQFRTHLAVSSGVVRAEVDVSTHGASGPWTNVWRKTNDCYGPVTEDIDISGVAAGKSNVMVRFHYLSPQEDYHWQIDDVKAYGNEIMDLAGDGVPNWWERLYFNGPTNASPEDDSDSDGISDGDERSSGTDPTNSACVLAVVAVTDTDTNGVIIRWSSAFGRFYRVGKSANLFSDFQPIASNIPASPPVNSFVDGTATGTVKVFYLIELE